MVKLTQRVERQKSVDYFGSGKYTTVEVVRPTKIGKVIMGLFGVTALLGASVFTISESGADVFGDSNTAQPFPRSEQLEEASKKATEKYEEIFTTASPAGKFALQYLTETTIVVDVRVHEPNNGSGLAGLFSSSVENEEFKATFNDGCLSGTAYDTNGGDITGIIVGTSTGFIEGEIPTALAKPQIDSTNPDILLVQSGEEVLKFSGLIDGDRLTPADQFTVDQVDGTQHCDIGLLSIDGPVFNVHSSPWVEEA